MPSKFLYLFLILTLFGSCKGNSNLSSDELNRSRQFNLIECNPQDQNSCSSISQHYQAFNTGLSSGILPVIFSCTKQNSGKYVCESNYCDQSSQFPQGSPFAAGCLSQDPCDQDSDCVSSACLNGACQPQASQPPRCLISPSGSGCQECYANHDCASGRCNGLNETPGNPGTCTEKAKLTEFCFIDNDCERGRCVWTDYPGYQNQCLALMSDSCAGSSECITDTCSEGSCSGNTRSGLCLNNSDCKNGETWCLSYALHCVEGVQCIDAAGCDGSPCENRTCVYPESINPCPPNIGIQFKTCTKLTVAFQCRCPCPNSFSGTCSDSVNPYCKC